MIDDLPLFLPMEVFRHARLPRTFAGSLPPYLACDLMLDTAFLIRTHHARMNIPLTTLPRVEMDVSDRSRLVSPHDLHVS